VESVDDGRSDAVDVFIVVLVVDDVDILSVDDVMKGLVYILGADVLFVVLSTHDGLSVVVDVLVIVLVVDDVVCGAVDVLIVNDGVSDRFDELVALLFGVDVSRCEWNSRCTMCG
jgi:hypothetical protein